MRLNFLERFDEGKSLADFEEYVKSETSKFQAKGASARQSDDKIKASMCDNGDDTVTVRFWQKKINDKDPANPKFLSAPPNLQEDVHFHIP